jgi:HlyD family secretion protein
MRFAVPAAMSPELCCVNCKSPKLKEELAQKTAAVAQANAEVLQADASVKVAEAAVRSASAKVAESRAAVDREESLYLRWDSEFQRVSQLADSGAVTRKVADETRAQRDAADAGRKEVAARIVSVEAQQQEMAANLEKAKADAVAARSRLVVAEADERRLAAMVDYTVIRAPFDGVVVERNVHTGHLVHSGASQQKPLFVVMRTDPVRVMIDVPEVDAVHVTPKTKVEIKIPSLPGSSHVGTITRSSWSLNETSRTMSAEVHLPKCRNGLASRPVCPGETHDG